MTLEPTSSFYGSLDFNSPMTGQTADKIVSVIASQDLGTVLDIGCGWAELLLRVLEASPEATGVGVDSEPRHLQRAERNAKGRALADRVSFAADLTNAAASDVAICVGSEHVFGTHSDALRALWSLVRPGGCGVFGTLFWQQSPSPGLLEDFGELPQLDEVVAEATDMGWGVEQQLVSSLDDWDTFEHGFMASWPTGRPKPRPPLTR